MNICCVYARFDVSFVCIYCEFLYVFIVSIRYVCKYVIKFVCLCVCIYVYMFADSKHDCMDLCIFVYMCV